LRLFTTPLGAVVAFTIAMATGGAHLPTVAGGTLFALAAGVCDTLSALHRGSSRHGAESLESAMPVAAVALCFVLVLTGAVDAAQLAWVTGALALGLVCVRAAAMARHRPGGTVLSLRHLVFEGRWFVARALVTSALFDSQTLLLQQLSERSEVALYAIAVRPLGLMTQALSVLTLVFLPVLSRTFAHDRERFDTDTRRLNLVHLCAIPPAFAACVVGGHVFLTAAGPSYVAGIRVVAVLAMGAVVYLAILTVGPLIAARQERGAFLAAFLGLVVLVIAAIVLIPMYGAMGGAIASVIAFAVTKLVHAWFYIEVGLSLGDRGHAFGYVVLIGFFVAVVIAPAGLQIVALAIGGTVGALLTIRMLANTVW
jgi:O-antigen/teichoic acid export membrane protein